MTRQKYSFPTLEAAIEAYNQHCKPAQDMELEIARAIFNKLGEGFTDVELAEYLLCGPHQLWFRMANNRESRDAAIKTLADKNLWNRNYKDFEELYAAVYKEIGKECKGVGALTCYDIAKKMSAIFDQKIRPASKIYLQSGALKRNPYPYW